MWLYEKDGILKFSAFTSVKYYTPIHVLLDALLALPIVSNCQSAMAVIVPHIDETSEVKGQKSLQHLCVSYVYDIKDPFINNMHVTIALPYHTGVVSYIGDMRP